MILSIIVPVFNVDDYIYDCLKSLLNQDILLTEYEIICINDGSTDKSLDILMDFESKYPNIIVLNQLNKGVSSARNSGMKIARGKYIWFIDSDDLIAPKCLNSLIKYLIDNKKNMLQINVKIIEEDYQYCKLKSQNNLKNGYTIINKNWDYTPFAWAYIWNSEVIKNNRFNENLKYAEDYDFVLPILIYQDFVSKVEDNIYFYRIRQNSVSTTNSVSKRIEKINSSIVFCDKIIKIINESELNIEQSQNLKNILWDTKADIVVRMLKLDLKNIKAKILYKKIRERKIHPYEFKVSKLLFKWNTNGTVKSNIHTYFITVLKVISFSRPSFLILNFLFKRK